MPVADENGGELHLLDPDDYDPADLRPSQGRAALAPWYLHIAVCVAIVAAVLLPALSVQADAVDLTITISGNSSGQGLHTMSFSGEAIRVNVSQENETSWNVTADGGQHDDV